VRSLTGAAVVLPDRVIAATLVLEDGRISEIVEDGRAPAGIPRDDFPGHLIVPGFIDVHVHGVEGFDTLGPDGSLHEIARRLPRFGVTAFCPTTIACSPADLGRMLGAVRVEQTRTDVPGARVLGAHLESNFISPEYRGAQPLACLCLPPKPRGRRAVPGEPGSGNDGATDTTTADGTAPFSGEEILAVIARYAAEVGIVTLAPELPHALDLTRQLVGAGHRVSVGHSGATLEQGRAAADAGARQATHLFNRMPPLAHREPGLVGAVLERGEFAAEIVCDGYHVHPVVVRAAIAVKGPRRTMVITDGTAGSALPVGSRSSLGGRPITVREAGCFLDDGTLAGSSLTMDRAFKMVVESLGLPVSDAARMCATTQSTELGLRDQGAIAPGARADLVVLDNQLRVRRTFVGGEVVWAAD
jgi:N-acetylglucosamine-6-phosphate deacetylase